MMIKEIGADTAKGQEFFVIRYGKLKDAESNNFACMCIYSCVNGKEYKTNMITNRDEYSAVYEAVSFTLRFIKGKAEYNPALVNRAWKKYVDSKQMQLF